MTAPHAGPSPTNALRRLPAPTDVLAGASVALLLIPQAMAYAELAGLPPQVGLFAAALPTLFAAPFASSPFLQTGPVALTALLTFGVLEGSSQPFSPTYIALAALLALLVGIVRIALGFIGLGNVAYLLSNPVLIGFTTGAAILIVASQLPRALGTPHSDHGVLLNATSALIDPTSWQLPAVAFATLTGLLMVGGRRLHPLFPGVLIAVIGATLISRFANYSGATLGELSGGFVRLSARFDWAAAPSLLPGAVAIALVGFAEPSSIARTFAAQERQSWSANREMISQGVANIVSGISGGLPVGGSFSRSALGKQAGGSTAWTGAISGLVVLALLPLTPLVGALPRAALATIIVLSVVKLIKLMDIVRLFRASWPQGLVALGTVVATLSFAPRVERGVFVGVGLAIAVHLYRELNISSNHHVEGGTLTVSPQGVLWFATVPQIERLVRANLANHPAVTTVHFDLAGVGRLDYTGAATLRNAIDNLAAIGIACELINVPPGAQRAVGIHCHSPTADHQPNPV